MNQPAYVPDDPNPHGNAYWMAYREAANMTDEQIIEARTDVTGSIAHANRLLAAAQGRDNGLADVQQERALGREGGRGREGIDHGDR